MSSSDLIAAKRAARDRALGLRASLDPTLGHRLTDHVLRDCPPPAGAAVAGFWPMDREIDIRPLLHALHKRGHAVVLPATGERGAALTFHLWEPSMDLVRERFGTLRSSGEERCPNFLLVPLLAFDRAGGRLGYGGGYYDRTLAGLPGAFRLGCAYAAQEVERVPAGPHDARLDAVATEEGVFVCKEPE
ncbi:MAG TPA: 5-formyltetrahydrofolate cyclo-ligase [Acetobacteraceae bacterium]|nr:5-formyltetrahydrofolate cyclo-ligase [Acetobacteraceae bacterium]